MSLDKRRKWTATEKMRIVMTGMQANVDVAELCRREGINPTQYYGWKKQLLSSASKVFEAGRRQRQPGAEARQEAKIQRLERVIAEITTENLELKKGLSE
jgi:transposase-like protein